jgi:tetrahydromethanopterin S-methyltransferase subunit D
MLARIRKAIVGGVLGGLGAGVAYLAKAGLDGTVNADDISQALGAFVAAAAAAGYAVFKVRNAGSGLR